MRKADYFTIARKLKADICAPLKLASTGKIPSETWQRVESEAMYAKQFARYLGQYLDLPLAQRKEFLRLCGMDSEAHNLT